MIYHLVMVILNVLTAQSVVGKTFTVTNNMGSIVWNCYKAGCRVSGGKRVHLTAEDIRKSLGSVAEETHSVKFDKPEWIVYNNAAIQDFCDQWKT